MAGTPEVCTPRPFAKTEQDGCVAQPEHPLLSAASEKCVVIAGFIFRGQVRRQHRGQIPGCLDTSEMNIPRPVDMPRLLAYIDRSRLLFVTFK